MATIIQYSSENNYINSNNENDINSNNSNNENDINSNNSNNENDINSNNENDIEEEMIKIIEENLGNVYENLFHNEYIKEECKSIIEKINNEISLAKKIEKEIEPKKLSIILISWISCTINLLAIYQIISVKNALFDEIINEFVSCHLRVPREKTFYKRIINETLRYIPELEIFLLGQIFSGYFKKNYGFWRVNIFCYLINSGCLIGLIFLKIF